MNTSANPMAEVMAVVVSYEGGERLRETVGALRAQVGAVCVVDNGSSPDTQRVLGELRREGVQVVELPRNMGLGHALNTGVRRALSGGFSWVLTMDQDSLVGPGMVAALLSATGADPKEVSFCPLVRAPTGRKDEAAGGRVSYAITSGNLVRTDVIEELGGFDEGFFIDCVDFDFCLRLRRAGYLIRRVAGASMDHRLGEEARVPAPLRRFYALHGPTRRYYMTRNYFFLAGRHFLSAPVFVIKLGLAQLILTGLVAFLDPHPLASYRAIARGVLDFVRRKQGQLESR